MSIRSERGRELWLDLTSQLLMGVTPIAGHDRLEPARAVNLIEKLIDSGSASMVIGSAVSFKPLILAGEHLYLQKMLYLEDRFVEVIGHRVSVLVRKWSEQEIDRALSDVLARPVRQNSGVIVLESEQQEAVKEALRHPTIIISGGPGTGKTTIIISLLRTLFRLGCTAEEIALAAPTGKAANRMGEAIRAGQAGIGDPAQADRDLTNLGEPRTLHRLLEFSRRSNGFRHHENNRLSERIVIVDETSMIDLALMERLVRSLRDDSHFILLGDARQLPSVEAGAVLRDLLEQTSGTPGASRALPHIELTQSHRMRPDDPDGRNIFTIAQTIDRGVIPDLTEGRVRDEAIVERSSVRDITFHRVEFITSQDGSQVLADFLNRWHREILRSLPDLDRLIGQEYSVNEGRFTSEDEGRLQQLIAHWGRSRILCFTRVLATGADQINAALHQQAVDSFPGLMHVTAGFAPLRTSELIPGEPVMMTVNDYERKIYNGDQGLVVNVTERDRLTLMIVFPQAQRLVAFPAESLQGHLQHSYAITVHKAQGSEFDRVAIILPDRDVPINTREILYTALTRSRTSAVLIGRRNILESGIARRISRESGIAEKLRTAAGG